MGLLFAETAGGGGDFKTKAEAAWLQELGCKACPLNSTPGKIDATGSTKPEIYVLGEAAGAQEEEERRQFVGKAGQLLRSLLPKGAVDLIRWNNVSNCHPPKNRNPSAQELACCRPRITKDVSQYKPRVIWGFGNIPLTWVSGFSGINNWRGRRMPVKVGDSTYWYYPFFHPSFLGRIARDNKGDFGSEDERITWFDLQRAYRELDTLAKPVVHTPEMAKANVECITDIGRISKVLQWASREPHIGQDYETNRLRPYEEDAKILTVGVGTMDKAYAFPIHHPGAGYSKKQIVEVEELWRRFLMAAPCVKRVHHLAFELEWSGHKFGIETIRARPWEDTANMAAILDERTGRKTKSGPFSLEFLCQQRFGFNLKKISNVDRAKLESTPLEVVLLYNGMDAKYHDGLGTELLADIEREDLMEAHRLAQRRVPTVVLSQLKGVPVDQVMVKTLFKKYDKKVKACEGVIQDLAVVKKFTRQRGRAFNPFSTSKDLPIVLDEMLGLSEVWVIDKFTKVEKFTTEEAVLNEVIKNHPEKSDAVQLVKALIELREASGTKAKYIDSLMIGSENCVVYPDGLIHTNFNTFFAETGRLCVAGNTVLNTSLGPVKISELDLEGMHRGVKIQTHTGHWQSIAKLWFKGFEAMYRVQTRSGASIDCTSGHQVLTRAGWKDTASLKVGSQVVVDPSYASRCDQSRSITSIRNCTQQECSAFERAGICLFATVGGTSSSESSQAYGDSFEGISSQQDLVYAGLRTGHLLCEGKKLCPPYVRQYPRGAFAKNCLKQTLVGVLTRSQSGNGGYSCRNEYDGISCQEECHLSRIDREGSTSSSSIRAYDSGSPSARTPCPRDRRGFSAQRVLHQSKNSSGEGLRSIYGRFIVIGEASKGCWSQYWRTFSANFLAAFVARAICSKGLVRARNRARASVGFSSGSDESLYTLEGRFYGSKLEGSDRSRRAFSCEHSKTRSESREEANSDGLLCISNKRYSGQKSTDSLFRLDEEDVVISINSIGVQAVWDITVEGDHSYCAQGLIHHNSSDDPNLQNFPKRDAETKEVRKSIAARPGEIILAFDYGQIEARVIAMFTKDKTFVKALWERWDVHEDWAKRLASEYPSRVGGRKFLTDKKVMKDFRTDIKNQWTFPLFFGATARSVSGYLQIPQDIIEEQIEEFWKMFPDAKEWQESLIRFYQKNGYVECMTGRRRRGPLTTNQLINAPVQGTAAEIVLDAMSRLSEEGDPEIQPEVNIHDDLTFIRIPSKQSDKIAEKVIDTMLMVPFKWAHIVPITVEMSMGKNWCELEEIGTYSSDTWRSV